jgi:hypothetical protein
MTVRELSQDQLNELKQAYVCEKVGCPSYGELADSVDIPNEVIYAHYAGYDFVNDDFWCSCGQ